MKNTLMQLTMVAVTMLMFLIALVVNEWMFHRLEWAQGIHFIYLPAGVRLLCTLLFAEAGAVGLLIVSWLVGYFFFFPEDPMRAFMGGIMASLAPYGAYRVARRYGIAASLQNLTPKRLLALSVLFALASPLLHHLWFAVDGGGDVIPGFFAMFMGDLSGTLIVLYAVKWLLHLLTPTTVRLT